MSVYEEKLIAPVYRRVHSEESEESYTRSVHVARRLTQHRKYLSLLAAKKRSERLGEMEKEEKDKVRRERLMKVVLGKDFEPKATKLQDLAKSTINMSQGGKPKHEEIDKEIGEKERMIAREQFSRRYRQYIDELVQKKKKKEREGHVRSLREQRLKNSFRRKLEEKCNEGQCKEDVPPLRRSKTPTVCRGRLVESARVSRSLNSENEIWKRGPLTKEEEERMAQRLSIPKEQTLCGPGRVDITLWKKRKNADKETKVFQIFGPYHDIRESLIEYGWIENEDRESSCFDFRFTVRKEDIDYTNLLRNQIVNHYEDNTVMVSKVGLCRTLKHAFWYADEDVNSFFPRTYDLSESEEWDGFEEDFRNTAAESILKVFVCCAEEDDKILNCPDKETLESAMKITRVRLREMNALCEESNERVPSSSRMDISQEDRIRILTFSSVMKEDGSSEPKKSTLCFLEKVKEMLEMLKKINVQYELNGLRNVWIVKPGRKSRGRGIQCFNNLLELKEYAVSPDANQWIAQKYCEIPLVIQKKKFDIRQWVMVTSFDPLTILLAREPYLRFCSVDFTLDEVQNREAHLSNNCVQKHAKDFNRMPEFEGNMWTSSRFAEFLKEMEGGSNMWEDVIVPQIRHIVTVSLLCAQEVVVPRKNTFEVLGYDLMVDANYAVWLIEVNSSPDFSYSTPVTEDLVRRGSKDVISQLHRHMDSLKKGDCQDIEDDSFFELIYRGDPIATACPAPSAGSLLVLEGKRIKCGVSCTKGKLKRKPPKQKRSKSEKVRKNCVQVKGSAIRPKEYKL